MSTRTRGVVIVLTCMVCASAAAAQSSQDAQPPGQFVRQQARQQQRADQRRPAGPRRESEAAAEATEEFVHVANLVQGGTFDLRNFPGGNVTITGGSGREVRIQARKVVRNGGPRAQAVLAATRITVAERGGNVEVQTVRPAVGGRIAAANRPMALVDYVVVLPSNANVVVRSGSGTLRLQNVSGDAFDVNTLSGDVVMEELRGRRLTLYTVTGDMQLRNVAAERALLQSMAGNLEYMGRLVRTGQYRFSTHRGNISVIPIGPAGFDLDAMTYQGDVRSDFVLTVLPPPGGSQQIRRVLKGKFGDAGAALTASSFGGNIVIVKR